MNAPTVEDNEGQGGGVEAFLTKFSGSTSGNSGGETAAVSQGYFPLWGSSIVISMNQYMAYSVAKLW